MARLCKSLKVPEQGYGHRDHRSAKNRKPISRTDRLKRMMFKRKQLSIQEEVEAYENEMTSIRMRWSFKK